MNEHTHTKRCMASAMISAIENARDAEFVTDQEFRGYAQNNTFLTEADSYLNDGTQTCTCGATMYNRLWHELRTFVLTHHLNDPATSAQINELFDRVRGTLTWYYIGDGIAEQYKSEAWFKWAYDFLAETEHNDPEV